MVIMTMPALLSPATITDPTGRITAQVGVGTRPILVVRAVGALSGLVLAPMIIGHVIGAGIVDPRVDPISYYAFVPGGYLAVAVGAVLLALCGAVLAHRLTGLSPPGPSSSFRYSG